MYARKTMGLAKKAKRMQRNASHEGEDWACACGAIQHGMAVWRGNGSGLLSKPAVEVVREQHSGFLVCGLAIHQRVDDGVDGNKSSLVAYGAVGILFGLGDLRGRPELQKGGLLGAQLKVEPNLANLPLVVL